VAGGDWGTDELVAEAEGAFGGRSVLGVEGLCRRGEAELFAVVCAVYEDAAASCVALRSYGGVKMDGLLGGWLIPGASRFRCCRHMAETAQD
jgi:hypothetical protein